jgi:hypothetical protein
MSDLARASEIESGSSTTLVASQVTGRKWTIPHVGIGSAKSKNRGLARLLTLREVRVFKLERSKVRGDHGATTRLLRIASP